ncbi:predicted protein [Postia placenta Mad-698-R]|nr:predicted protein [Postia placenta Mad-698-R]
MSTTIHNDNAACCSIPPVRSDYTPKGSYKSYPGFTKVYVTGPTTPGNVALICVYDIFGFKPQTQQGADILADQLNAHVVMPDFFEPDAPWPADKFPPKTDEEKAKLQAFFGACSRFLISMLSSADATELKVPLGLYPSQDEPQEEYKKIVEIVSKKPWAAKNDHKFYDTFHGFAAARANLDDPKNKADFEDLYATLIKFYGNASGTHTH